MLYPLEIMMMRCKEERWGEKAGSLGGRLVGPLTYHGKWK